MALPPPPTMATQTIPASPAQPAIPGTEETPVTSPAPSTSQGSSFWDDPALRPPSSEYAKFVDVGDTFGGTIAKMTTKTWEDTGTVDPVFIFAEDDAPTLTAGPYLLKQALYELRPVPGDKLTVTLTKVEKRGTKTHKHFRVELTRKANGETQVIDHSDS